jgi:hypothetical protein
MHRQSSIEALSQMKVEETKADHDGVRTRFALRQFRAPSRKRRSISR